MEHQAVDNIFGSKRLRGKLDLSEQDQIDKLIPVFAQAISRQENDATGQHGVRSLETSDPKTVLKNSIFNNFARWKSGDTPAPWIRERPRKFIDFMQLRWAPLEAENDPEGLNKFWRPGVRSILKQLLGESQYKELQKLDLVKDGIGNSESNKEQRSLA